jgi:hypothetical protein
VRAPGACDESSFSSDQGGKERTARAGIEEREGARATGPPGRGPTDGIGVRIAAAVRKLNLGYMISL